MGTKQGHVLGRLATEEEERKPQLGSVLLRRSAAHPLHAGVVGDVLAILQHFAAFNLPAHAGIVYVFQAISIQGVGSNDVCHSSIVFWVRAGIQSQIRACATATTFKSRFLEPKRAILARETRTYWLIPSSDVGL